MILQDRVTLASPIQRRCASPPDSNALFRGLRAQADVDLIVMGKDEKPPSPIVLAAKEDQDMQASWLHVTRRLRHGRQDLPSNAQQNMPADAGERQRGAQDFQAF